MNLLKKLIPILDWLPRYNLDLFKGDLVGGITIGIVLIPQGIAYALVAGLPPIYGLYAALVPQLIHAIFGTARQVAIGPVAMDSLIVATGVSTLALTGSDSYIAIAILLALMVGVIQFLLGVFQLGFVVNFLSKPVITGFTSAVALAIGVNQFRNLFGVDFIQSDRVYVVLVDIWHNIIDLDIPTTIIGLIACVLIILIKKINKKIPYALIIVVLGILSVKYFDVYFKDVDIVKDIPSGLPSFSVPELDMVLMRELFPIAITLVMIGFLETITIGKSFESKQEEYRVRPNQELIALGLSNIMGSLFKSYPAASSFSRSAINLESGSKTGVSAFIAALLVMVTLLFFTPLFYYLPKSVLAAIIIVSVFKLISFKEARFLWRANNLDFWLLLATFISTLLFGIDYGIAIGVGLSLIVLIFRTSKPYTVELGKVPNSNFYRNKDRFSEVLLDNEVLVFRFDAQLFYANANYFRDRLDELVENKGKTLGLIVLDTESINRIDSTGVEMLKERVKYFQKKGVCFYFAGVKGPVRDVLFRGMLLDVVDITHFFMRVNDAVVFYKTGDRENQKKYANYIHQAYK